MKNNTQTIAILSTLLFAAASSTSFAGWKMKWKNKNQSDDKQQTSQPAAPSMVCDAMGSYAICYAFTGAGNSESNTQKGNEMACKLMKGSFAISSTCKTDGVLGKCAVLPKQPKEYTLYYYSGGPMKFTPASAETDCKNPKSSLHAQGAGQWSG